MLFCLLHILQENYDSFTSMRVFTLPNGGSLSVPSTLEPHKTIILLLKILLTNARIPFSVSFNGSLKNSPVSSALQIFLGH